MAPSKLAAVLVIATVLPASKPWIHYHDANHHFSVQYPATWHRAPQRLTPYLASPREILSVGTGRLPSDGGRCAQAPVNALEAVGASGALITLLDAGSATREFARRPAHFSLLPSQTHSELPDCLPRDRRPTIYWIRFRDHMRAFYALVALGKSAPSRTQKQAVEILDSLRFQ